METFIAFGDVHESIGNAESIPGIREAAAVIVTGDITNRGTASAANRILDRLQALNPRILAQAGNMDTEAVTEVLRERGANIHRQVVELSPGLGLMGLGWSTPTPFGTPSEATEETLALWLEQTYVRARQYPRLVLVAHDPPHGTAADRLGDGRHVGSRAVRAFVEKARPDLCLSGHIHESRAEDRLGETLVFNPGMLAGGSYVRVVWDGSRLSAILETVP